MKIVVTGGAGFIGSHITEMLCDQKHDVVVIDNLSFGYEKFVDKRATFIKGDFGNSKLMQKILPGAKAVIHLAGSSIIKYSYEKPALYFENNLFKGIKLLDAMRATKVKKIIFSSTAAVYGYQTKIPIKESAPKSPRNAYGASKLAFEEALQAYYYSYGIESVSLRYFNAYGPRDEQQPATRAIPMWMKAMVTNQPVTTYWEGKQIRDYIFVKDIAKAHLAVLSREGLHTYNIGSGTGILMKIDKGEREGDPHYLVADITKIKKEIGWVPTVKLSDGLTETFAYYKKSNT
jgi:UDP-glucose 4-epimerase